MTPATDVTDSRASSAAPPLRVAIFDDVVAARNERFHIPGLEVEVFPHADDAATLSALGVTDAERQQLATLYRAGQSLWQVPITHFTP